MDTVDFHIFAAFSTTLMNNANPSQPVYKTVVPSQACSSVLAKTSLFFFFLLQVVLSFLLPSKFYFSNISSTFVDGNIVRQLIHR